MCFWFLEIFRIQVRLLIKYIVTLFLREICTCVTDMFVACETKHERSVTIEGYSTSYPISRILCSRNKFLWQSPGGVPTCLKKCPIFFTKLISISFCYYWQLRGVIISIYLGNHQTVPLAFLVLLSTSKISTGSDDSWTIQSSTKFFGCWHNLLRIY